MAEEYKIGIDCEPGEPRPGDLFPGVIEGTGLVEDDFEEPSRMFGAWTWRLKALEEKEAVFKNHLELIYERLGELYNSKQARACIMEPWPKDK